MAYSATALTGTAIYTTVYSVSLHHGRLRLPSSRSPPSPSRLSLSHSHARVRCHILVLYSYRYSSVSLLPFCPQTIPHDHRHCYFTKCFDRSSRPRVSLARHNKLITTLPRFLIVSTGPCTACSLHVVHHAVQPPTRLHFLLLACPHRPLKLLSSLAFPFLFSPLP